MKTMEHNETDYPVYTAPKDNVLANNLSEFDYLFKCYCARLKYNPADFHVDESLLVKVFLKTDRQKLRYKIFHELWMNEPKVAGILAYWIIRYKPIVCHNKKRNIYSTGNYNESFALYLMLAVIENHRQINNMKPFQPNKKLMNDIIHVVLHRALSEDLMSMLSETLGDI